jgi:hypothetical protein
VRLTFGFASPGDVFDGNVEHLKQDHRMKRNYLRGQDGDCINALLVGCGFNLRKLLRVFFWLIFGWPEQALEINLAAAAET